jgi:hypothetical protein
MKKLTAEYQLGYYVGEYIYSRFLPTLSTDLLQTRNVIKVSEEDELENKRLYDEWFKTSRFGSEWNSHENIEKWNLYQQHNKMLEEKYLPHELKCYFGLLHIKKEKQFKDGLINSLWNCDMCYYSLKPEDITIEHDSDYTTTTIIFKL